MAMPRQTLRRRREQQGLTREKLALDVGVATSTVQKWELGITLPRVGLRPRLAGALDLTLADVDRLLDGSSTVLNGHAVPGWLGHLASLEQAAAQIWSFEPIVVHGLLQTAGYAAAVERADAVPKTEEGIAQRVRTRLARQGVLDRDPDPLDLSVVLDESVLYRVAGDKEVMAEALAHLVGVAERPNIDLRVLPLDAGVFCAAFGAFTLFGSPESEKPFMACTEDRTGAHYLDRPFSIDAHVDLFQYLADVALPSAESVDLISSVVKEKYT